MLMNDRNTPQVESSWREHTRIKRTVDACGDMRLVDGATAQTVIQFTEIITSCDNDWLAWTTVVEWMLFLLFAVNIAYHRYALRVDKMK